MLSYQHAYHAGNLADLHKHAALAWMMDYLTAKPKPLTYLETHAGRGLYDLSGPEAAKTGEAQAGITRALDEDWLGPDHPLSQALDQVRSMHGPNAYPGSPLIARYFLRPEDNVHLAELHPTEHDALAQVGGFAHLHRQDGFQMANALCPPTPRRGLLLIDPSYEVKADYQTVPRHIAKLARKWNVGVIALWYPVLADNRQAGMVRELVADHPDALLSQVSFPAARPGHGMIGSGMFVINPPYGLDAEMRRIEALYADL